MSRFLDDRGRLFGRVNIVDLVVLAVIVAIVVFAAVRFTGGGAVETVPVKITFIQFRAQQSLVPGLQGKGTITDSGGNVIGDVLSVQATPSIDEILTQQGEYKRFSSSTRSDVTFVVLGKGTISGSSVHVGSMTARVGGDALLIGPGYEARTVISKVVWGAEALK